MRRILLPAAIAIACLVRLPAAPVAAADKPAPRPNVLFIAIDDLRDWVGYLGHKAVRTPNLDRLAARGESFTRSYCAAPVCNASRAALMSGLRPSTSGVYENNTDWRPAVGNVATLPQHFRQHGYFVAGAGKLYHGSYPRTSDFDVYGGGGGKAGPDGGVGGIKFAPHPGGDEDLADYHTAEFIIQQLQQPREQPFFLACGFVKPHMPWCVPQKYFDMYPLERIELPPIKEGDLADVPAGGLRFARPEGDHAAMLKSGRWKEAIQAYLATITYMDAMLGRLLEALDKSPHKDNTIICLWSDHGWHLGEKEHWRKFALWEEATRSPLLFVVPGMTKAGSVCERPVDFMHLYPTLCDLCGIPTPKHVEGVSLKPLLAQADAAWDRPAVTTYHFNNHTVRSERWRYIRYADGGEELYDHSVDPHEWTNRADDPQLASVKQELARWLPRENKPEPKESPAGAAGQGKKAKAKAKAKTQAQPAD